MFDNDCLIMIIIFLLLFYTFHKGRLIEGAQNNSRKRRRWANRLAKNPVNWTNNVIRISGQFRKAVGRRNRKRRSALAGKLKALCVAGQQQQPKLDWPNTEDAVVVASRLRLERYGCNADAPSEASPEAKAKQEAEREAALLAAREKAKEKRRQEDAKAAERLATQQRIDTMHNKLIAAKVNTIVEEKLDPVLTAWCPRWCEKRRT